MATAVLMTIMKKRKHKWWAPHTASIEERKAVLSSAQEKLKVDLIRQGMLCKRGARVGDAWNPRWVFLSASGLWYNYYEEATQSPGPMIDYIPIEEVQVIVVSAIPT